MSLRRGLLLLSISALAGLLGISTWASLQVSIVPALQDLWHHPAERYNPWLIATLFDAYFGFLWFYVWIAYKETALPARAGWLVAVLLTGNMAMAIYMLWQLHRLPAGGSAADLLLRRGH